MSGRTRVSGRNRIAAFAAAVAVGVVASIGVAVPANAANSPGCSKGYTCLYSGYDYTWDAWQTPLSYSGLLGFLNCIDQLTLYNYNDVVSSVYNAGYTDRVYLYEHEFQGGARISYAVSTGSTNLGSWNDKASSAYFSSVLNNHHTSTCQ